MENVRTRTRKDVENAKHFGIQKFSKDVGPWFPSPETELN